MATNDGAARRNRPAQGKPKLRGRRIERDLDVIRDIDDLLDLRMPLPQTSGVYFLFLGRELVYIGQSLDVTRRVIQHRDRGKILFDAFAVIPVDARHLDYYERHAIRWHRPRLNVALLQGERENV